MRRSSLGFPGASLGSPGSSLGSPGSSPGSPRDLSGLSWEVWGLPREVLEGKPAAGGQNQENVRFSYDLGRGTGRRWPKPCKNLWFFYDLGRGNRPPVAKTIKNLRFLCVLGWAPACTHFIGRAPSPPALYQNCQNPCLEKKHGSWKCMDLEFSMNFGVLDFWVLYVGDLKLIMLGLLIVDLGSLDLFSSWDMRWHDFLLPTNKICVKSWATGWRDFCFPPKTRLLKSPELSLRPPGHLLGPSGALGLASDLKCVIFRRKVPPKMIESCSKSSFLEFSTGPTGSARSAGNNVSQSMTDHRFHTRWGPGWHELTQTPSN